MLTIGEEAVMRRALMSEEERCIACGGYGYKVRSSTRTSCAVVEQCRFCIEGRQPKGETEWKQK